MLARPPAVAGLFYPEDPFELRALVRGCLEAGRGHAPDVPRAIVAPHAGYVYSGPVAGSAYASILPLRGRISRVVLLGPSHRVAFRGLAVPSVDRFRTPLGLMRVDTAACATLVAKGLAVVDDEPHRREHSLEVQLPFLQEVLGDVALVPIVVGFAQAVEVERAIETLWDAETLVVVSSDLSHYHGQRAAERIDARTRDAIERLAPEQLEDESACGRLPIAGLLRLAKRRGLEVTTLDLRTSGDTAGPRDEVVGYGAFALTPTKRVETRGTLSDAEGATLLDLARRSVAHAARTGEPLPIDLSRLPPALTHLGASFVTLHRQRDEALRGCIGTIEARRPLALDVAENAAAAALRDTRFAPVDPDEVEGLDVSVSILEPTERLAVASEAELLRVLRPRVDGLVLTDGRYRGVFLPAVWEDLPDPQEFVDALRRKAGMPRGHWSPTLVVERFGVRELGK